ncbi:MAG TPA: tetratricopeptide repeat protein [Terriglobales bacterium]|nr:tetratricopeptide repeat protein [Terriglobales bacterium]
MSDNKTTTNWSSVQAYSVAVLCLLVGIAAGWFIRGSQSPATATVAASAPTQASAGMGESAQPTPEQMKKMADTQAAPLLKQIESDPNNAGLIAKVGNIYYDTQQYPVAIDYYQRFLKLQPANANVRTDMATAYWYMGNVDSSIAEFNKALSYEPNKPNALFNLGVVKWQGKMDVNGAVATWQKLLDTNPTYENRDKVEQLIAQAKKHTGMKPGQKPQS